MRLKKGRAAHPGTHKPVEVVLVRPPLYLTLEEFDLLCAKAVAAGFAPPDFLDRGRRQQVRQSVVAELCRRAVLASLLGVTRFKEVQRTTFGSNHPMAAYQRQKLVGARFTCLGCRSRTRRSRSAGAAVRTARRLRDEAVEKAKAARAREAALRTQLRATLALVEELQGGGGRVLTAEEIVSMMKASVPGAVEHAAQMKRMSRRSGAVKGRAA